MRGVKIKLKPTPEQARTMDRWRRGGINLWNLLLGMEQAAYDGSKFRPELRWREIWAQVVKEGYADALHSWKYGKKTKYGIVKKKPGEGKEPVEPPQDHYQKISGSSVDGEPPKLFIWESDLQKIMARLKENPTMKWIEALPSHSSQQVCKDVVKAIKTMLLERKKRKDGAGGRDTGFPRFKKSRYAVGSVYMVNTQTIFDHKAREVKLPKLKQAITFRQEGVPIDGKLQGGRIWRLGEQWWLSCQFEVPDPKPYPHFGRECGVKISASILATTFDGEKIQQTPPMKEDRKLARRIRLANRRLARRHKGTKDYYKTADELANLHAKERNRRDDMLHKVSDAIVKQFDTITVHKMDVKSLMTTKRVNKQTGDVERVPKILTKANKRAAMAQFRGYLGYKAVDRGRTYNETHTLFPEVQKCSRCGKLHYMPLEKRMLICDCGNYVSRQANAAQNEYEQGQIAKAASQLKRAWD